MYYRILNRMKVTAILPDELVRDVQTMSGGKNITESLHLALTEWLKITRIKKLNEKVARAPLTFTDGYSAAEVRKLNRKSR